MSESTVGHSPSSQSLDLSRDPENPDHSMADGPQRGIYEHDSHGEATDINKAVEYSRSSDFHHLEVVDIDPQDLPQDQTNSRTVSSL